MDLFVCEIHGHSSYFEPCSICTKPEIKNPCQTCRAKIEQETRQKCWEKLNTLLFSQMTDGTPNGSTILKFRTSDWEKFIEYSRDTKEGVKL